MTRPDHPLANLPPGTRVGDLTVIRPIGSGGQSAVYLAMPVSATAPPAPIRRFIAQPLRHSAAPPLTRSLAHSLRRSLAHSLRRSAAPSLCALKLAPPDRAVALHAEHALLSRADSAHPHLVALYSRRSPGLLRRDLGVATVATPAGPQPCHWLALAHVPGRPLAALIDTTTPEQARAIIAQVAAALQHLHQALGAAHLDVTPANIIVDPSPARFAFFAPFRVLRGPRATLIDLGAAERIGHIGRRHSYGTPPYLAPERRSSPPAPPAPQADIYALGVLLAGLVPPPARGPALDDLISLATLHCPARRAAALPSIGAFLERLNRGESPALHP